MVKKTEAQQFKYPGRRMAMDGNTAVIMCERAVSYTHLRAHETS